MSTETRPSATRLPARRWRLALASIALVAVAVAGAAYFASGDDPAPLELSLGAGDSLASCLVFDVAILADMSPAFAGTVTAIDSEHVTLRVDHWYAGGDAEEVTLAGVAGSAALIGEIDFQEGDEYLITAAGGQVNYCGYSGPASPELRAAFDQAFAG